MNESFKETLDGLRGDLEKVSTALKELPIVEFSNLYEKLNTFITLQGGRQGSLGNLFSEVGKTYQFVETIDQGLQDLDKKISEELENLQEENGRLSEELRVNEITKDSLIMITEHLISIPVEKRESALVKLADIVKNDPKLLTNALRICAEISSQ